MNDPWEALYTDRRRLTTAAYADSTNLMARASMYRYQQPPIDLIGWALDLASPPPGARVLDIGCGPGRYLQRLASRPDLRLTGMDLSRGMLLDALRDWPSAARHPRL